MLPDMPKLKHQLFKVQMEFFRWASHQQTGVFSACEQLPMYEGNSHGVERATGDKEINSLRKTSSEIIIEPSKDTLESTFLKLLDMAKQAGQQIERKAFEDLAKTLNDAGQTVNAKNKNIEDALYEMFEKIEIPLDENGNLDLSGLQIVCGEEMFESMKNIDKIPELNQRLKDLMRDKEEKARAREANRKLVG